MKTMGYHCIVWNEKDKYEFLKTLKRHGVNGEVSGYGRGYYIAFDATIDQFEAIKQEA